MRAYRERPVARWTRAHRLLVDGVVAGAVTTVALLTHFFQRPDVYFHDPSWRYVPWIVVACVPLAWRRLRPIPAALAVVAAQIALDAFGINGPSWLGVFIVLYCLGAYAEGRPRLRALAVMSAAIGVAFVVALSRHDPKVHFGTVLGLAAMLTACYLIGEVVRRRRLELATLAARAERAERERELLAGQRVADERARIARELHDVVAHSVSVMVIQAAAARRNIGRDPDAASSLLGNVEETGRQTMSELRQILGVLREADGRAASSTPLPTLRDLPALVEADPELDVHFRSIGTLDDVPPGVALSAFRVVQEALTNVRRHAGPHVSVDVDIARTLDGVDVTVADNGRGASVGAPASALAVPGRDDAAAEPGYGLIGMSERVAAFGGTLRTGPRRAGGWQVHARFPVVTNASAEQASADPIADLTVKPDAVVGRRS